MTKLEGILTAVLSLVIVVNSKIISSKTGDIAGRTINVLGHDVDVYLGIPYAIPPIGELRFKPSVPINPWKGIFNAIYNPPTCMQVLCFINCSEDCLYLNIWVPRNRTDSTMVWIHGGLFTVGSINEERYDGRIMSVLGGVIVASINYRLGPFGFLVSGTEDAKGNMGMKDQVLGLQWIKDNIKSFGGDPSKITIFGQSAGGISVSAHLISPLTKDLFRSSIIQSASAYHPYISVRDPSLIKWRSSWLAVMVGCANYNQDISSDPKIMKCLRKRKASSIINAEYVIIVSIMLSENNPWLSVFHPIYGDDYLPIPPIEAFATGKIHVNKVMIGNTVDEGSLFLLLFANPSLALFDYPITTKIAATSYIKSLFRGILNPPSDAVVDYYLANSSFLDNSLLKRSYDSPGDWVFDCTCVFLSEIVSSRRNDVYYYIFNHRWIKSPSRKWMGVVHNGELNFEFGLPFRHDYLYTPEEKEFSKELIGAWTSFAKAGKPMYKKLSGEWPLYNSENRIAVDLNPYNVRYVNPYKNACQFWKNYF